MGHKAINMISKPLELHILSPYPGMATFLFGFPAISTSFCLISVK